MLEDKRWKQKEGRRKNIFVTSILGKSAGSCLVPSYFRTEVLILATNLRSHPKGRHGEKERTEETNEEEDKKRNLAGVVGCT